MRRLLAALVIMIALTPSVAYAGEPSSVLIADPARRLAGSAHHGDARYQRLAAAVGLAGTDLPRNGASPPAVGAVFRADVRLTWLRDDTEIWRIDLIFVTPSDGLWIATGRSWISEPSDAVWHRPADPDLLRATLIDSGLAKAVAGAFPPLPPPSDEPRPGLPLVGYVLAGALAGIAISMAAPRGPAPSGRGIRQGDQNGPSGSLTVTSPTHFGRPAVPRTGESRAA
ncbi:hypothetical protein [Microlunatus parietis]|uniref:Uncharacterized protein n=1 Tax=Microlunatus parietis TaxID=682979 RepID=A0A7Y9I5S0_9ACTN|nr:hypothetical protein [Microlunatus parietis]NYE70807.1 hypothetical protein [Microlunatus parietis]